MQDDSPTDVITFSGDPDDGTAGEICVCPEAAQSYAKENGKEFAAELTLYLAHGYLHLCGFDDIEDDDKIEMRRRRAGRPENACRTACNAQFLAKDIKTLDG